MTPQEVLDRLASIETLEAVARALLDNNIGDPAKGEPFFREHRRTEDVIRDADTAISVIRAKLTAPTTGRDGGSHEG